MKEYTLPRRYELPKRGVFAVTRDFMPRHHRDNLRSIANDFNIIKRRQFYEMAHELAERYCLDKIVEDDLLHSTEARDVFVRSLNNGIRLAEDISQIFRKRHLYSMWSESCFTCEGELEEIALEFRRTEFHRQLYDFLIITDHALSKIPHPPASRKKNLALRNWTYGHLSFWANDLEKPVTLIHDQRDGYSDCHRWLRALLAEIDPGSLGALGHILREQKQELREKSEPE
jgi:hypothetical protein